MSDVFLVKISEHSMDYDSLNAMANDIVKFALKNKLGVHFNSDWTSGDTLISNNGNYFTLSNSFLHENANFLSTSDIIPMTNSKFNKKFKFIQDIFNLISTYKIRHLELFITPDGVLDSTDDFYIYKSNVNNVLNTIYSAIIEHIAEYSFEFPPLLININNNC